MHLTFILAKFNFVEFYLLYSMQLRVSLVQERTGNDAA